MGFQQRGWSIGSPPLWARALLLTISGAVAGAGIALAAARLLSAISADVAATVLDPLAYGGGIAVVLAASLAAAAIPAGRAARVDPVTTLRLRLVSTSQAGWSPWMFRPRRHPAAGVT